MLESILISKSRSFPTDIGWTGEMNWASFFCTHQFLPRQWNTDWSAQHYSFAFMEFNHLHHYRKYYRFIDQMLTPEFLTTQGRKPFHKLKKGKRHFVVVWSQRSSICKTKLFCIKLHFSSTRTDSCLERLREYHMQLFPMENGQTGTARFLSI